MAAIENYSGEAESPCSTPLATPMSAMTTMSTRSVRWERDVEEATGLERPLLHHRGANTTSQMAVVGANVCPIESLDYEYVSLCFDLLYSQWPS